MKSTLRVDFCFDTNEPFIQVKIPNTDTHYGVDVDVILDLADKTLKSFLEQANNRGLQLVYPIGNSDNRSPQIRLGDIKA